MFISWVLNFNIIDRTTLSIKTPQNGKQHIYSNLLAKGFVCTILSKGCLKTQSNNKITAVVCEDLVIH